MRSQTHCNLAGYLPRDMRGNSVRSLEIGVGLRAHPPERRQHHFDAYDVCPAQSATGMQNIFLHSIFKFPVKIRNGTVSGFVLLAYIGAVKSMPDPGVRCTGEGGIRDRFMCCKHVQ